MDFIIKVQESEKSNAKLRRSTADDAAMYNAELTLLAVFAFYLIMNYLF